jgi:hypothetical protein
MQEPPDGGGVSCFVWTDGRCARLSVGTDDRLEAASVRFRHLGH